ncbi:MAG: hypothetical protein ABGY41_03845, partial [Candidatus Poribacteria bacterium]
YAVALHAVEEVAREGAIAEFTKAMSLEPRNSTYVHALADLHISDGYLGEAVKVYTTFLEKNPRDKRVLQRRDMLKAQAAADGVAAP